MKINIQDIIPFMKDGWVAMDKCGEWCWYQNKPFLATDGNYWGTVGHVECFKDFDCLQDIEPAEDWKQSLRKVGGE